MATGCPDLLPEPTRRDGLLDSRQPSQTEVRMRVIGFLLAFNIALAPLPVKAQAASQKTFRVGYLTPSGQGAVRPWEVDVGKLGYVEGRNLTIELRNVGPSLGTGRMTKSAASPRNASPT